MKIHPALTLRGQLDSSRPPISLDLVADAVEEDEGLIDGGSGDIDGQVEIAMHPRLSPEESIDTPAAGHPDLLTSGVQGRKHPKNLPSCQTSPQLNPF